MIVRIATEDQYRLPDEDAQQLNELDNETVQAAEAGDEARFAELFAQMLDARPARRQGARRRRARGVRRDPAAPGHDLAEAAHEFTGDGLIPD